MKKPILLLFFLATIMLSKLSAQTEEPFKPSGKPEVRVFSNFNSEFSDGENVNKFEITRAYLGYGYNFSKTLYGRLTFDVGNPSAGKFQMAALLKFAYLQYQKNKLTASIGMIPTTQFEVQEKQWGYRYIYKSFQDEYSFGPSADIGGSLAYKFSKKLSADLILVNGEGYKTLDLDSALKVGAGITYLPVKGLTLRGYYDNMAKDNNAQETYVLFSGYGNEKFNLNAEYNYQKESGMISNHDMWGYSFYGTAFLKKKMKIFARYDLLESNQPSEVNQPWNILKDGKFYNLGFEFSPANGVKISPNIQGWDPASMGKPFVTKFYLNLEFRI
jgi:hypothetical protein